LLCAALALLAGCLPRAAAQPITHETIVFMRHGEKPAAGLGQINCQGLNRALALPKVLAKRFGTPAAIFAPDPAQQVQDHGISYDYIRPLATIEPTAVSLGLPVDTTFGVRDTEGLIHALTAPDHANSLIFVAWEHRVLPAVARILLQHFGGNPAAVTDWPSNDFDSLYVLRITREGTHDTAAFTHEVEGLNNLPAACP
jgi:broad specificity phosphatase PhoE